jgi:hypothetical protein
VWLAIHGTTKVMLLLISIESISVLTLLRQGAISILGAIIIQQGCGIRWMDKIISSWKIENFYYIGDIKTHSSSAQVIERVTISEQPILVELESSDVSLFVHAMTTTQIPQQP